MTFAFGVVLGFVAGEVVTFLLIAFFVGRCLPDDLRREEEHEHEKLIEQFRADLEETSGAAEEDL